jgi:hypothetical protein
MTARLRPALPSIQAGAVQPGPTGPQINSDRFIGRWRPDRTGWGGRIRNFAFRMIVIEPERFRRRAARKPAHDPPDSYGKFVLGSSD